MFDFPQVEEGSVWGVAPATLVPGAALRHIARSDWHLWPQLCDVIEANVFKCLINRYGEKQKTESDPGLRHKDDQRFPDRIPLRSHRLRERKESKRV